MKVIVLILIIIIPGALLILAGYYGYSSTHKNSFKDNIISIVHIFKAELESVNNALLDATLTADEKQALLERRDKLIEDLNLFYGEKIYN